MEKEEVKQMSELIRKQDAIDATTETVFVEYKDTDPCKEKKIITQTKAAIRDRIKALPTVQVEPLTDYEQRLFLSAMEKEKKVCEKLTREYDTYPSNDGKWELDEER